MPCDCEQSTLSIKTAIICTQKDSSEFKIVNVSWCPALPSGATIAVSAWTIDYGDVTISDETLVGEITGVTISAGTPGTLSIVSNTIETDSGLILKQVLECYVSHLYTPVEMAC